MVVLALLALLQQEDPKVKTVREAYEDQVRRERLGFLKPSDPESLVLTFENGTDLGTLAPNVALNFLRMWIKGAPAYSELIEGLDGPRLRNTVGRVRLLNRLTGRQAPLPQELTETAEVKRDWQAWFARRPGPPSASCAHDDDQVRRKLHELAGDSLEERAAAESELRPCAGRHAKIFDEAIAATTDVEALARLRALRAAVDNPELRADDLATLKAALALIEFDDFGGGVALLRAERKRFQGPHRETVDLLVRSLERRP